MHTNSWLSFSSYLTQLMGDEFSSCKQNSRVLTLKFDISAALTLLNLEGKNALLASLEFSNILFNMKT